MKYSIVFFLLFSSICYSQNIYEISFENNGFNEDDIRHEFFIDTISNSKNCWRIGKPEKNNFKTSVSEPNSIVTDLSFEYPTNDTSSFIIYHKADDGFMNGGFLYLEADYYVNSDTLTDFGQIDISFDKGKKWFNMLTDSIYNDSIKSYFKFNWNNEKPVFSGESNEWKDFKVNFEGLGKIMNVNWNDTILFRFSFISDNKQTNKDGLMFDDIRIEDADEGILELKNNNFINIYPDPANEKLNYECNSKNIPHKIQLINSLGQVVYEKKVMNGEVIDLRNFPSGNYQLKYSDNKHYTFKSFVISH